MANRELGIATPGSGRPFYPSIHRRHSSIRPRLHLSYGCGFTCGRVFLSACAVKIASAQNRRPVNASKQAPTWRGCDPTSAPHRLLRGRGADANMHPRHISTDALARSRTGYSILPLPSSLPSCLSRTCWCVRQADVSTRT